MIKVSCLQENLTRGLATAGRGITKSTLPITESVLLKTHNGMLQLTGTNLETQITTWIGAIVEEEGEVAIPYRRLADLINSLPSDRVDLEFITAEEAADEEVPDDAEPTIARITCDRSVTHIKAVAGTDFPARQEISEGTTIRMDPTTLRNAVGMTHFTAAPKGDRHALHGLLMHFDADGLTMAGADGYRLSLFTKPVRHELDDVKIIVPLRTMQDVQRMIGDQSQPVELTLTDDLSQIKFRMDDGEVVSQLIKAKYPNYENLIPGDWKTRATMDVEDFRNAVQTANVFAKDGSRIIRIETDPKDEEETAWRMRLSARSDDAGDNAREIDLETVEGESAKIAFNCQYLQEICAAMNKGKIAFEMKDPSSPGVVRWVDDDSYLHIMMPMYVQW